MNLNVPEPVTKGRTKKNETIRSKFQLRNLAKIFYLMNEPIITSSFFLMT